MTQADNDVQSPFQLPEGIAAQAQEAASDGRTVDPDGKPVIKTKMVMWRDRSWMVRAKPNAAFLVAFEDDRIMAAVKSVLGPDQFKELLELDPDIEGDTGVEGLLEACNRAWGVGRGN